MHSSIALFILTISKLMKRVNIFSRGSLSSVWSPGNLLASGGARALLNEMSDYDRHIFDTLVEALKSRYGSTNGPKFLGLRYRLEFG
jgi:hypothetical protein